MGKKEEGDDKKEEDAEKEATEEKEEEEAVPEEEEELSWEDEVKKVEASIELTEQEKTICFSKGDVQDLYQKELSSLFGTFTLPDESDGFDEIRYVWKQKPECEKYLKAWIS